MDNMDNNIRLMRQGKYNLQEVVSEIQEIARVSEGLVKINSLVTSIASHANFLSIKAAEEVHARGRDTGMALVAHEAYKLAEFSNKQSKAIWNMFMEIKESLDKINCSTSKILNSFGVIDHGIMTDGEQKDDIHAFRVTETGQVGKAAEVVNELAKMSKNISSLVQSVSRVE